MQRDELEARSRASLREHDLSLGEHLVMCSVGYRVTVEPAALVRHVLGSSDGDPRVDAARGEPGRGATAQLDLEAALASCVRRGWLKILDARDFDASGRRVQGRDSPLVDEPGFEDCEPGQVDFTPEGYRVHQAVVRAIFGDPARDAR